MNYEILNIPKHENCVNCGKCCGLIPATKEEIKEIQKYIGVHHITPNKVNSIDCPFRNEKEKRCDIYPVRPLVCRLFGVIKMGRFSGCPQGNSAQIDGYKFLHGREETMLLNFMDWEVNQDE